MRGGRARGEAERRGRRRLVEDHVRSARLPLRRGRRRGSGERDWERDRSAEPTRVGVRRRRVRGPRRRKDRRDAAAERAPRRRARRRGRMDDRWRRRARRRRRRQQRTGADEQRRVVRDPLDPRHVLEIAMRHERRRTRSRTGCRLEQDGRRRRQLERDALTTRLARRRPRSVDALGREGAAGLGRGRGGSRGLGRAKWQRSRLRSLGRNLLR